MISPSSRCLPFSAGLCGRFTKLVFSLTVIIYVLLVSGMLVKHVKKKKGATLRADVMFLIIHIALKLLIFHFLDSAHTMCQCFQIPTCFEESLLCTELLGLSMNYYITLRLLFALYIFNYNFRKKSNFAP